MRCGYSIWATDIGDYYDRIQQGRCKKAPLHMYIRAMRDGNPRSRSSIHKLDNGSKTLVSGIRNYHHVTSSGRRIKIYYALEDGIYRVCELGKIWYIKCNCGEVQEIDEQEALQ